MTVSKINLNSSSVKNEGGYQPPKPDIIYVVWYLLLQAVNIQQKTVEVNSETLQANTEAQNKMDAEINSIQLNAIPVLQQKKGKNGQIENVNGAEVAAVQAANQQQLKIQSGDESEVVLLRQIFQTTATAGTTEGNNLMTLVQVGASLSDQIEKISLKITNKQNLG